MHRLLLLLVRKETKGKLLQGAARWGTRTNCCFKERKVCFKGRKGRRQDYTVAEKSSFTYLQKGGLR